ncbi:MAG: ABC transporter substrate-binding protein [Thermomicrobiales bacterium]
MMRSKWTRGLQLATGALLVASMAMPEMARAQDDKVELLVWDQFTDPEVSALVDEIYAGFTAENPNVTIKREAVDNDQLRQTLRTSLSSGEGPDVIFYDAGPGYAGVLADSELIIPLDEYAATYGWKDKVAGTAMQGTTIDGKLYGMPLQVDLIGMYVDKAVMDEHGWTTPTTLGEMLTFCKTASEAGVIPIAFADNPGWQAFHQFSMTANQMIGADAMQEVLYNGGTANWNSPEIVAAIKAYFSDMMDAGCFPEDAVALTYDDGNALFYSGEAALHTTGSWLIGDIEANMEDASSVEFVPFPALDGGKGRYWITGVGSAYYVTANSKHPDEAAAFIDHLFHPDVVADMWVERGKYVVPVEFDATAVEASPLFASVLGNLQASLKGEAELGFNVDVMAPQPFNDMMLNGFQAMLTGDKTAEQQAADLQAAWEEGTK